jgi:hypothetical protein
MRKYSNEGNSYFNLFSQKSHQLYTAMEVEIILFAQVQAAVAKKTLSLLTILKT